MKIFYKVTQYITTKLTDSDLSRGVPQLGQPTEQEIQVGHRLFLGEGIARLPCQLRA